ncbi:DUF2268 domain-containing protein [Aquimarina sp. 2201CG5-10]|uniref:DUF2268 domain-containing protein n=1 Tax=Aquimarina callyspongiae TaxID=3098150 RepID=UPI002AB37E1D|nr:DUF2268 domain-containing putative Zn-dependent protease [Aquimarina sp. 2201CG5-10]MDY8136976.1 DUF2268 domain-containing putative Zn-dependent protease [Aquimarina sp. 2201CG5-10]
MKNLVLLILALIMSFLKSMGQKPDYEVIFLDQYYSEYIASAKQSDEDLTDLYLKKVRTPIFHKYFLSSEYNSFVYEDLARPSLDIPYLEKTLKEIASNKKQIKKTVIKALKECNKLLKSDKMTIYILPSSSELKTMVQDMSGVFGFTAGSSQVLISIDPTIKDWQKMLPYAVAHEYNHTYWTKKNLATVTKWTLLDYLVFEGRGDYFAKLLYPKIETPWTEALTEEKRQELWQKIQPHLENQDFSFQAEVIFGSYRFPMWGGYCLGYDIVQSSLSKDNSSTPETWINFPSEQILNSSTYQNK